MKASCYARLGMEEAEISMLGLPQEMILPAVRNIVKDAADISFSDQGGAWAHMAKEGFGSYL